MDAVTLPKVLSEEETLERACKGASIARFGDGELRLALGGQASAQVADRDLANELVALLRGPTKSLVCIPRYGHGPKKTNWERYEQPKFVSLMHQTEYGSAFITRPDSAPNINRPEFWKRVRTLWRNRNTVLVVGTDYGSLNDKMLRDASRLEMVYAPRRDAYGDADALGERIRQKLRAFDKLPEPCPIVILCLGPTATVMVERLAQQGHWAVDLGHIGKLMPEEFR